MFLKNVNTVAIAIRVDDSLLYDCLESAVQFQVVITPHIVSLKGT